MSTSQILALCLNSEPSRSTCDLLPDVMSSVVTRCITTDSSVSLIKVHTCSLVVSWLHREIIVTKPYLVSKEAQLYSLSSGQKSSSILFGETFLLAN